MSYLLDTDFILACLWKNSAAIEKLKANLNNYYLSTIVTAELYKIAYQTSDPNSFINDVKKIEYLFSTNERIYTFDNECAEEFGKIQGELMQDHKSAGLVDTLIAAIARAKNLKVLSKNSDYFHNIQNIEVESWMESGNKIIFKGKNKVGVLHKAAKILAEHDFSIKRGKSLDDLGDRFEITFHIDKPANISQVKNWEEFNDEFDSILLDRIYHDSNIPKNKNLENEITKNSDYSFLVVQGIDRKGLIRDITETLLERGMSISVYHSYTTELKDKNTKFSLALGISKGSSNFWETNIPIIRNITNVKTASILSV